MFCNQCEQTARGTGCDVGPGVCEKSEDIQSLQDLLLYGLKGMAAYANHARRLGVSDPNVSAFIEEALLATMTNVNFDFDSLFELCMKCGENNLRVMEMLDEGHVRAFGSPAPALVNEGTRAGQGILVTGHDLLDLWTLLQQLEGTEIQVYTHGEMLPAHMYPKLREHPNLAGHYGGAWQRQKREFAAFAGPIVATANCVLIPKESYADRLFTTRATAVPGGARIVGDDFGPVIEAARRCPALADAPGAASTVGFHHSVILEAAETIVEAVKDGSVSHFFLIGGCDGPERSRDYYARFAECTPPNSFILTLGCGRYRIRDHDYGTLLGLPRLLDMGQCNDAYGAIRVASGLAEAFECSVNDLPLTMVVSWFEQKAVAVLLTLLSLGVTGIRIGPKAPAFISQGVFEILQERFDLKLNGPVAQEDLEEALGLTAGAAAAS